MAMCIGDVTSSAAAREDRQPTIHGRSPHVSPVVGHAGHVPRDRDRCLRNAPAWTEKGPARVSNNPFPAMFAPQFIAEVIIWGVKHTPPELLLGRPPVRAIWGQKLVPGLLDR